ncbi:asparagine synthase C-terminal domain-containing protein [Nanoarchaeota archaeon]
MIKEKDWIKFVNSCKTKDKPNKKKLEEAIIKAVEKRVPKGKFAVFFSGGIDSSLIALLAKKYSNNFTCYSVGFKDKGTGEPVDLIYARKVAKDLDIKFKEKTFNLKETEKIFKKVVKILGKPKEIDIDFIVKLGVGSVLVAASQIAKEKVFFSGLGAEEVFAGYLRHKEAKDVDKECWRGLRAMYHRDLMRDLIIAKKLNIKIETPFLDKDVIKEGMKFPASRKLKGSKNKIVLREIAQKLGLKKEIAWRKKLGAQYGSRFGKAIEKLARKKGFRYKKDLLNTF